MKYILEGFGQIEEINVIEYLREKKIERGNYYTIRPCGINTMVQCILVDKESAVFKRKTN